jgi:hypothetical protein
VRRILQKYPYHNTTFELGWGAVNWRIQRLLNGLAHDMRLVQEFREEGISGTKESTDRPAWTQMITALYSNGVRTIVIEKPDRLAGPVTIAPGPLSAHPISASILARTSASSSGDTVPLRAALRWRQSTLFT